MTDHMALGSAEERAEDEEPPGLCAFSRTPQFSRPSPASPIPLALFPDSAAPQRRGVPRTMKAMIKRRSAIEPTIGHMKSDGRLDRNPLKGALGDALHAVLCGAGHNIRLLLSLLRLFVAHLLAVMLATLGQYLGARCRQAPPAAA